jgi:hypothetical protein
MYGEGGEMSRHFCSRYQKNRNTRIQGYKNTRIQEYREGWILEVKTIVFLAQLSINR